VAPFLAGTALPPNPNEAGWKDTIMVPPGTVVRILVRWAPTDIPASTAPADASFPFDPNGGHGYVWHCHIVDHEDNEMMRPDAVQPNTSAKRTYIKGTDY
jgi:FtsP/CotA-like multicopper oxidase with cupredoxin domain